MKIIHLVLGLLLVLILPANAYRIEISYKTLSNTSVFLAACYGDQVAVIDSTAADASGKAVFERNFDLSPGMYTIVAPGKTSFDLLLDAGQQLKLEWVSANHVRIEGDEPTAAWAAYQTWMNTRPERDRLTERRQQLINQFPGTFLADYLTALLPVEPKDSETTGNMSKLMQTYHYRRHHYFDNMPLSDVRLLRTPLYHETIHYYITKFVTQHTDTLIHIAYRMLEQASGNYETFYYVSDFLIDFSLRSKIKDINKLYTFLIRNRDMVGAAGLNMLPAKASDNYFKIPDEKSLQDRLEKMPLTDIDGQTFHFQTIRSKYRLFYFWHNDCPRCVADVKRFQSVLERYADKSCFAIAVNIKYDVSLPENRILAYDPMCVNASAIQSPWMNTIFFTLFYSKIILTDTDGNIIGIFASPSALDSFLRLAR